MGSTCKRGRASALIFTFVTFALARAARCDPLSDILQDLSQYQGDTNLVKTQFIQQQETLSQTFKDNRNMHHVFLELAAIQSEILLRNFAIKSFVSSKLNKCLLDAYEKPLELDTTESRDRSMELLVARAKMRAKITMLQANKALWTAWYKLASMFDDLYKKEIKSLAKLFDLAGEKSIIMSEEDYNKPYVAYQAYYELKPGKGTYEVYKNTDSHLDSCFECGTACEELKIGCFANAAPVAPISEVDKWLSDFADAELLAMIEETRAKVREVINVTDRAHLPEAEMDEVEKYRAKLVESSAADNKSSSR